MTLHIFVVRVEEHRVVAAEIQDHAAAASLDAGYPVLLGTAEDLGKVARRLRRPLVTIARTSTATSLEANSAVLDSTRQRSRGPVPAPRIGVVVSGARGVFATT